MKQLILSLTGIALLLIGSIVGIIYFNWIYTHSDWQYFVIDTGFRNLSGITVDDQQRLLISEESNNGFGRVVRLNLNGSQEELFTGLNEPDAIRFLNGRVYYSEEQGENGLSYFENGTKTNLFKADSLEGFDISPDHRYLYSVEDTPTGRLLQYDNLTKNLRSLVENLNEPEGVCAGKDYLYYTEKAGHTFNRIPLIGGSPEVISSELINPAGLKCDYLNGVVWILEERQNFGRLLRYDGKHIQTIAKLLGEPQEMLLTKGGHRNGSTSRHFV